MRHKDRGEVNLVVKPAQPAAQFLADLGVKRAKRLVKQQHLGIDGQRPGQGDPLPLPAGQLVWIPAFEAIELHQLEKFMHPLGDRLLIRPFTPAFHPQAEGNVFKYGQVAEQRIVLEDEADLALARRHICDVLPMKQDPPAAGIRIFEPRNDAQERGLAGARRTQQRHQLATRHVQADASKRGEPAEGLADVVGLDAHMPDHGMAASAWWCFHSMKVFRPSVTRASNASSDATAKAATKLYSL